MIMIIGLSKICNHHFDNKIIDRRDIVPQRTHVTPSVRARESTIYNLLNRHVRGPLFALLRYNNLYFFFYLLFIFFPFFFFFFPFFFTSTVGIAKYDSYLNNRSTVSFVFRTWFRIFFLFYFFRTFTRADPRLWYARPRVDNVIYKYIISCVLLIIFPYFNSIIMYPHFSFSLLRGIQ